MQGRARGFTLIELIVTILVAGILMAVAMPSFTQFMKDAALGSQARSLLSDLQYARSEAVRRNLNVALCPSADGASCGSDGWNTGRLVFVDDDRDGSRGPGEELLRISEAPSAPKTLTGEAAGSVSFRSTGQVNSATTFIVCDERVGNFGRLVSVETSGRSDVSVTDCGEGGDDEDE
ncbi:prepilin-type N-terminal cleavage/methylation domain-containing protein [Oxalicibacterium flavum]|uniref:Type II secretion system protein H n=1 Tax=Oxalicibacterium flavum TaxID=179467 RepID=A0A8J2ULZ5_9BURK|nr:GspH/FimT family pseudopilin [Oxalicibacterium flavum]GGC13926.1 prepilin-type N-terminal cleavage/methylation domain-containing protein [Oxalicibacterium flavum]